jgi:enoyl-CoA hydratase
VRLDRGEGLAFITMDRPATRNALTPGLAQALVEICQELAEDPDVRAVVLRGGDDFCAGLDPDDPLDPLDPLDPAAAIAALPIPTLAAIRGACIGPGLALALACDLRFAARGATFALPDLVQGSFPAFGSSQRLPRTVGRAKALEIILTGATLDADEAYRIDLVSQVVEADVLDATVLTAARAFLGCAPIAVRYAKEALAEGLEGTLDQGLRLEADLYLLLHTTHDRREGIQSFLARRVPRYRGE